MKAIVQDQFGPPEVLRLADIDPPEIGPGDVLVRVHAAGLNPYDWHMLRGDPLIARLIPGAVGLTRPKYRVAGLDAAGVVEAAGADVRELRPATRCSASARARSPSMPGLRRARWCQSGGPDVRAGGGDPDSCHDGAARDPGSGPGAGRAPGARQRRRRRGRQLRRPDRGGPCCRGHRRVQRPQR